MTSSLIKGQTVFITGASSGIGKACADYFAALGTHLVITGRRMDRLKGIGENLSKQHGVRVIPLELDVRHQEEVEALFKRLEQDNVDIDILVNNAGLALALDKIQDGDIHHWDTMIDTNIKGLLYVTKGALPGMISRNRGHIINIGSVAGHGTYARGNVYSATKHAVGAITQSLRQDLLGTKLRVSEIDPGAVETEFSEVRLKDKEKAKKVYEGFDPLTPNDIADAVVYVATRPIHVNISEIIIYPQAQASLTEIYRQGD